MKNLGLQHESPAWARRTSVDLTEHPLLAASDLDSRRRRHIAFQKASLDFKRKSDGSY